MMYAEPLHFREFDEEEEEETMIYQDNYTANLPAVALEELRKYFSRTLSGVELEEKLKRVMRCQFCGWDGDVRDPRDAEDLKRSAAEATKIVNRALRNLRKKP
jgi:hypothetical protein